MSDFDMATLALLLIEWAVAGLALTFVTGRHPEIDITWKRWLWVLYLAMMVSGAVLIVAGPSVAGGGNGDRGSLMWIRGIVGAAMLAAVTNIVILGRWYLRRPGLDRRPLIELVRIGLALTGVFAVLALIPTGMWSVFNGSIEDGFGGLLGWFWVASLVTMIGTSVMVERALHEPYDGAVMTATGIAYLVVLTAVGTDLVPRLVLPG